MRTIAILNQKGGVGKTTTTVNLGAALAERGRRVLLVDMDPQAHLTLHLGIEPGRLERSVYDLLTAGASVGDVLIPRSRNLDVIPSHINLAGAEVELVNAVGRESLLRDALAEAKVDYDYMLIDCPPSLGVLTLNALVACREVFIPLQTQFLAMQGMTQLLETTQLVCRRLNPQVRVTGIIFCQFDRRTSLSREVVGEVRGFFGNGPAGSPTVFATNIRQSIRLAEAPSFGKTIFEYDRGSPGAADYNRLALEVLRQDGHAVALDEPVPAATAEPSGGGNGGSPKPGLPTKRPADLPTADAPTCRLADVATCRPADLPRADGRPPTAYQPLAETEAVPCVEIKIGDPASIMRTLWEGGGVPADADAETRELTPLSIAAGAPAVATTAATAVTGAAAPPIPPASVADAPAPAMPAAEVAFTAGGSHPDMPAIWSDSPDLAGPGEATRRIRPIPPARVIPLVGAAESDDGLPKAVARAECDGMVGVDELMMELEPAEPPAIAVVLPEYRRPSLAEIAARMRGR
jgi:chromosome partitioning protein